MADKISSDDLKSIAANFIERAVGYLEDEVSSDRGKALDYYYGEPFGDELADRSAVISTDVQDTIEAIMPDMVEIFAGGDELGTADPVGAEDVDGAEQATALVNHVWMRDNDGFGNTHDVIKDALLAKTGILKIWWDESDKTTKHYQTNLNQMAFQALAEDDEVEIIAVTPKPVPMELMELAPGGELFDVEFTRTVTEGRVKCMVVPPEEFLADSRTVDINTDRTNTGHMFTKTQSDLIEMGFDPDQIDGIPSYNEQDTTDEKTARWKDVNTLTTKSNALDRSQRELQVAELYLWVDWNGDGISELRQVYVAGPGREILKWAKGRGPEGKDGDANQEVDDHPFCAGSPIRMSHRWIGRSVADLVMDIQRIKSTIMRQWLDNMYFTNNGRVAANERVNLDDLLFNRPSGVVQVSGEGPIGDSIQPLMTPSLQAHAQPLLEYMDGVREIRTGTMRYNTQAPASNAYTGTLGGIQSILGQAQKRQILIARVLAEGLFKAAFKKIMKLLIEHQDTPRVIEFRGQWVPMSPKTWNAEMDMTINVGMGHGTREQRMALWNMVLQVVEKIVSYQGGLNGPFIFAPNIFHAVEQLLNAMGLKNSGSIITEPKEGQQAGPPQKPDPAMEKVKLDGQRLQIDAKKLEADDAKGQAELSLQYKAEKAKDERERLKMYLDYQLRLQELGQSADQLTAESILKGAELFVYDQHQRDTAESRQAEMMNNQNSVNTGAQMPYNAPVDTASS